ncbi:hypothetical protein PGLA_23745 [Paenibacillus glacialis]|uniref:Uncharacterized protein n=2 Tax=Paenibacillus glacialis TaxID=494026 RepID=A0A168DHX6_9BACL|nr:hypothetical protein PGLA_23745 [Paenibacillus glacialis]
MLLTLLLYSTIHPNGRIYADPLIPFDEDTRQLLEKSLSIVEIDSEIERISKRQIEMEHEQEQLELDLLQKRNQIKDKQERAGEIVRSYYMGERDFLYSALLSVKNISGLLMIYGYYELIMNNDKDVLNTYQSEYANLQITQKKIARNATELEEMKNNLIKQRERVLVLQNSVEGSLETSSNPEAMQQMMNEFTLYWENVGLYEVKRHFRALSLAMKDLPEFAQNTKGIIQAKGSIYTINITENQLNTFLRSKDNLFNEFAFHFDDGVISASGQSGALAIRIEGKYSIVNDPQNGIMFHVSKLIFNNLQLPDTTSRALEEEFDLGFYPQKLISFVKATDVKISENLLHITLKLSM